MLKKKRGQVTVYIILGIILLASAIIYFYFKGSSYKQISQEGIIKAQKIPKEALPVTNYITTQLDDATKKGLYLIGRQGGYIYESQGGPIPDPSKFITYDTSTPTYEDRHNVSYCIEKENEIIKNYYFPDTPLYPWKFYPYLAETTLGRNPRFSGFFGKSNLPDLNSSAISIRAQMEHYILNYLEKNINFSIFENQGFYINEGKINISFIITEDEVFSILEYPLLIEKKSIGMETNVSYFYSNPEIRLRKIYDLTEFTINKDITDILFNITNPDSPKLKEGMRVSREKNVYEDEDIIIVYDNNSLLYTEPYEFRFARENRPPALRFIYLPTIIFSGLEAITGARITKEHINPIADDPDEDEIIFTYSPELPYIVRDPDFEKKFVELNVCAHEKTNTNNRDCQTFNVYVSGEAFSII